MAASPDPPRWAVRVAAVVISAALLWILFLLLRAVTIALW